MRSMIVWRNNALCMIARGRILLLCNDTDLAFALKQAVCAQGFGRGTLSPDWSALHCIVLHYSALQYTVLDCNGNKLAGFQSF